MRAYLAEHGEEVPSVAEIDPHPRGATEVKRGDHLDDAVSRSTPPVHRKIVAYPFSPLGTLSAPMCDEKATMQVGALPHIVPRGPARSRPDEDLLAAPFDARHMPPPTTTAMFKLRYGEFVSKYCSSRLGVHQWAPLLLREVGTLVPVDTPGPHPLRSATAMFILDKIFETFSLPREVFDSICACVYVDGNHGREASAAGVDRYDYLERKFMFAANDELRGQMKVVTQRTRDVLRDAEDVRRRLQDADGQHRRLDLRTHFCAWRAVLRQRLWRRCATQFLRHRDTILVKSRVFEGWRRVAVEERLHRRQHALQEEVAAAHERERDAAAALQSDLELRVRDARQEMSASFAAAGIGKGGGATVDIEEQERREQDLIALTAECASLHRRVGELEAIIKVARAERDRHAELALAAGDAVHRALELTVAGRRRGGMKAADVLVNADSFAHGDVGHFRSTDPGASDVVVGPLTAKPHHILLAWVNGVVESVTGEPPHITQVGVGLCDGTHYATILSHIFPQSRVGARMALQTDVAERLLLFVTEGSLLLRQRDAPVTSASSSSSGGTAGARRKTMIHASASTPSSAALGGTPNTVALGSAAGGSGGDPGPIAAAGIAALDLLQASEPAHLVCLYFLFKAYAARLTVGEETAADGDGPSARDAEREAVTLYLCRRSLASWRTLLQHVEDGLVSTFFLLAKGCHASALLRDVRDDATMSRFVIDHSIDQPHVVGDLAKSHRASVMGSEVSRGDRLADGHESAGRSLQQLCPAPQERHRVILAVTLNVHAVHELFEHFSGRAPIMTADGLATFARECGASELIGGDGAVRRIFADCAQYEPDRGLHPPEFIVACLRLADAALPPTQGRGLSQRFEMFLARHVHARLRLVTSEPMRRVMQHPAVAAVLNTVRGGLDVFFQSVANKRVDAADAAVSLARDESSASGFGGTPAAVTLTEGAFVKLLRDLGLCDDRLSAKDAAEMFHNSQDAFDDSGMSDMSAPEFVEAISAVGLWRIPNPYYSSAARLNIFFNERLLPAIGKRFPSIFSKMTAAMKVDAEALLSAQTADSEPEAQSPIAPM